MTTETASVLGYLVKAEAEAGRVPIAVTVCVLYENNTVDVEGVANESYPGAAQFVSDMRDLMDLATDRSEERAADIAVALRVALEIADHGPSDERLAELRDACRTIPRPE